MASSIDIAAPSVQAVSNSSCPSAVRSPATDDSYQASWTLNLAMPVVSRADSAAPKSRAASAVASGRGHVGQALQKIGQADERPDVSSTRKPLVEVLFRGIGVATRDGDPSPDHQGFGRCHPARQGDRLVGPTAGGGEIALDECDDRSVEGPLDHRQLRWMAKSAMSTHFPVRRGHVAIGQGCSDDTRVAEAGEVLGDAGSGFLGPAAGCPRSAHFAPEGQRRPSPQCIAGLAWRRGWPRHQPPLPRIE